MDKDWKRHDSYWEVLATKLLTIFFQINAISGWEDDDDDDDDDTFIKVSKL